MTELDHPDKPLSIGEEVIITGRVVWASRDEVLIDLDGAPARLLDGSGWLPRAAVTVEIGYVRRREP